MKPFHILVGLGALCIIGVAAWYLYMTRVPHFPQTETRGISLPKGTPAPTPKADAAPPGDAAVGAAVDAGPRASDAGPGDVPQVPPTGGTDASIKPGDAAP